MHSQAPKIIFENEHFLLANKPANLNFHDEGCIGEGFFNYVKTYCQLTEMYPVHRLDKMTSGLLIFAKTKLAASAFQVLFEEHQIEKYYLAISDKKVKKKQGLIKGDMEKSRRGSWKLLRTIKKPAITQFFSYGLGHGLRLFLVKPHTGKTHQIRVALASVGGPILGDVYYSNSQADRGYLHAYAIKFTLFEQVYMFQILPDDGEHFTQLPAALMNESLTNPWDLPWPKLKH